MYEAVMTSESGNVVSCLKKKNPQPADVLKYITTKVSAERENVCRSLYDAHDDVRSLRTKEVLWWIAAAAP